MRLTCGTCSAVQDSVDEAEPRCRACGASLGRTLSMTPKERWQIRIGQEDLGPYSADEMALMMTEGLLEWSSEVLREGSSKWVPARRDAWLVTAVAHAQGLGSTTARLDGLQSLLHSAPALQESHDAENDTEIHALDSQLLEPQRHDPQPAGEVVDVVADLPGVALAAEACADDEPSAQALVGAEPAEPVVLETQGEAPVLQAVSEPVVPAALGDTLVPEQRVTEGPGEPSGRQIVLSRPALPAAEFDAAAAARFDAAVSAAREGSVFPPSTSADRSRVAVVPHPLKDLWAQGAAQRARAAGLTRATPEPPLPVIDVSGEVVLSPSSELRSRETSLTSSVRESFHDAVLEPFREPSAKLMRERSTKLAREPSVKLARAPRRELAREPGVELAREPRVELAGERRARLRDASLESTESSADQAQRRAVPELATARLPRSSSPPGEASTRDGTRAAPWFLALAFGIGSLLALGSGPLLVLLHGVAQGVRGRVALSLPHTEVGAAAAAAVRAPSVSPLSPPPTSTVPAPVPFGLEVPEPSPRATRTRPPNEELNAELARMLPLLRSCLLGPPRAMNVVLAISGSTGRVAALTVPWPKLTPGVLECAHEAFVDFQVAPFVEPELHVKHHFQW